ncbi:intraflagellar transport protein 25 homolog isoform X2 [Myxocyprinus asiaticus]|uniref:intraflagellar transport protein 25 homolog isoform X2 n=1 Tax=Myxocyprinus asiaticus TaxID=70543 RepID=UPI002221A5D9|nr:intraflagellar transport protein 25 homolog isoform X2 [Myxocyprinus asiaticus]
MLDAALSSYGAQIVLVSSSDENHPPENIIDGKTETFWVSTGMFPQEFIIRFPDNMKIFTISIHSYNKFEHTESSLQNNDINVNVSNATHLRFLILSGYDHFVSVHKVSVQS